VLVRFEPGPWINGISFPGPTFNLKFVHSTRDVLVITRPRGAACAPALSDGMKLAGGARSTRTWAIHFLWTFFFVLFRTAWNIHRSGTPYQVHSLHNKAQRRGVRNCFQSVLLSDFSSGTRSTRAWAIRLSPSRLFFFFYFAHVVCIVDRAIGIA
jgi:hypothetical protein